MAGLPNPKSYEQILGEMLASYMARVGINDLNAGSAVLSFFEAMAQSVYRASGDTFAILRDFSVDRAEGDSLKRLQTEEGVAEIPARVATGKVTIIDESFEKTSTKIYAGGNPPNIGSTVIKVSDASLFSASGSIYIGRGTPNIEGPLAYSSITAIGGYYEINLTNPTSKYHNLSENVVLAQGGTRIVQAGTNVQTLASGNSPNVVFTITQKAIVLDGENTVTNIPVSAQEPGTDGNVPKNSVREFVTSPFVGATVTNESPFTTGKGQETDDEIRIRIKKARISRGLGTATAVKNAVLGIQASDENATVTSNEIFSDGEDTVLYVDNGEGYEEKTEGVGLEFMVDSALGGETHFPLATGGSQTSVAKAFLESTIESPFAITSLDRLAILVGGILSEHQFNEGDFRSTGFATAFEIAASINSNPDLEFTARTTGNGLKITISAKAEVDEFIQMTDTTVGTNAGLALGFPSNEVQTLRLYKNRQPLNKNGRTAKIESSNQANWSNTIIDGDTLVVSADGTILSTYTFNNADFIAEGTHQTVAKTNTLQSWVNVINSKVTGITASINGTRLVLTSNLGTNSRAGITIDATSTLVTKAMFPSSNGLVSAGSEADYRFSRNTGQIKLTSALQAGDSLTAGTEFTKGAITSDQILGGSVTLAADAELWFIIDHQDDDSTIINAEAIDHFVSSDSIIHVSKEANNVVRYRSDLENAFINIQEGDYVIIWTEELAAGNRIEGRVQGIGTDTVANDYFEIRITSAEYALAQVETPIIFQEGISFIRTYHTPQDIKLSAGTYDINTIASLINDALVGADVAAENDEYITITTKTQDITGSVYLAAFNNAAKALNLTEKDFGESIESHFAFHQSQNKEGDFPLFIHALMTSEEYADHPTTHITSFDSAENVGNTVGNKLELSMTVLHPYQFLGSRIHDSEASHSSTLIDYLSTLTVNISESEFYHRFRISDRFYVSSPFDFGHEDSIVVTLDADASNKTFPIPMYRKAITNTTATSGATGFRAYDTDSGATTEFSQFFGDDFDFKNYKALMKARNVIDPSGLIDEDAVLFQSTEWGANGNNTKIGYTYPTTANSEIGHTIHIGSFVTIGINLKSGNPVVNTADGTTEWDVTITPDTPAVGQEEVTITHNGTGTVPGLGTLVANDLVTIINTGEFDAANLGTYKVSSATSTSFTFRRGSGSAVAETGIANLESNTISWFKSDTTTAQEIVDYVNASVTDHLTAEIVADNGTTGAGDIPLSTEEDNDFVVSQDYVTLVDGYNGIISSDLTASAPTPQFVFKNSLSMPVFHTNTADAYAFNSGEEIRLVPVSAKQINELISTLAVSGITTLGDVATAHRNDHVQISSQVLGSEGAVEISGGLANHAEADVSGPSSPVVEDGAIQFNTMKTPVLRSAADGFFAQQWVKIESNEIQKKNLNMTTESYVTIVPNSPNAGQSRILIKNVSKDGLFFGIPRLDVRDRGRGFEVERHGDFVAISHDEFTGAQPFAGGAVDIDEATGNVSITIDEESGFVELESLSGTRDFSEVNRGDKLVVTGMDDSTNNGTFKIVDVRPNDKIIIFANPQAVEVATFSLTSGNVVITTAFRDGDTVTFKAPFHTLNQGQFKVINYFNDTIYIENPNSVEEKVIVVDNLISTGYDATTVFKVTRENGTGTIVVAWANTGTEPDFSDVSFGDTVYLNAGFVAGNLGDYDIKRVYEGVNEIFDATCLSAADITTSQYFTFQLPDSGASYYIWYRKDASGSDPTPGGTGVMVDIVTGNSADAVASATQAGIDSILGLTATVVDNVVTVTGDDFGGDTNPTTGDMDAGFTIEVTTEGRLKHFAVAHVTGVAEASVTGLSAGDIEFNERTIKIQPYEAAIAGDTFVIAGDVLGTDNIGRYPVVDVLNHNEIVVTGILTQVEQQVLGINASQVYLEEESSYVGYKQITYKAIDNNDSSVALLVFNSDQQLEKINDAANTTITAMSKLEFPTTIKSGLDSYKFNTGLIAEANKTVYGDPRDNITYPGTAAAGAEIFIQPPLVRRVEVSVNIRVNTGVPFSRVTEQVRNNIASLINSSPIGASIAISDIISSINKIPGVKAVSISSPLYSPTSDVIVINPAEKPFVLDLVNDIVVSKID